MGQLAWSRRRSGRPGPAMQALCGVLMVTLPAAAVYAQPAGVDPAPPAAPNRPPGSVDPWTSADGSAPPPAYGTDALGVPGAASPGGGMIQVDVKADSGGVRLDRVQGSGATTVCVAPCSRLVPRNNLYVIDGDGIRSTSQFLLPDDRDQVTLNVQAGSSARHAGGAALMIGGIVVGYLGMFVAEAGLAANAVNDNSGSHQSENVAAVGGIMLAAGLVAAIGGLYLALTSSTKVTSSTGSTFTEQKRPPPKSTIALTPNGLTF